MRLLALVSQDKNNYECMLFSTNFFVANPLKLLWVNCLLLLYLKSLWKDNSPNWSIFFHRELCNQCKTASECLFTETVTLMFFADYNCIIVFRHYWVVNSGIGGLKKHFSKPETAENNLACCRQPIKSHICGKQK